MLTVIWVLFAFSFVTNVAMSVVPQEPVVIWYGAHWGIWATAAVATAGTAVAAVVDHRVLGPLVSRVATGPALSAGLLGKIRRIFYRAPFAVIAVSGVTPLPAWPFKTLAFVERYPLGRYVAAVAAGRFPRYVALAWLGFVISVPNWVLAALALVILLPSLRAWIWKRRNAK